MAQYKVTQWVTASVPIVSHVEANSEEEAEENLSNNIGTGDYKYRYDKIHYGELESIEAEKIEEAVKEDDMNYDISQADTRVALDWSYIDGRLYDDILQAFVDEHGEGYYDDWVITANKEGGVDESIKKDGVERLKTLINFRT